jgi:hypothetical protein
MDLQEKFPNLRKLQDSIKNRSNRHMHDGLNHKVCCRDTPENTPRDIPTVCGGLLSRWPEKKEIDCVVCVADGDKNVCFKEEGIFVCPQNPPIK